MNKAIQTACPMGHNSAGSAPTEVDPRKTAALANQNRSRSTGAVSVHDAHMARAVLRSKGVRQAGFGSELYPAVASLANPPVALMDGEAHRRQRAATAPFFSPKVVTTRYTDLMEKTSKELVERFRKDGHGKLEDMSMELSVTIAAEIVGLTDSNPKGMSRRLNAFLGNGQAARADLLSLIVQKIRGLFRQLQFLVFDVRPAIKSRKRQRKEDVISHMVNENYSIAEIMAECVTYGVAGMITTREFIVMAFWQLIERQDLRERFLSTARPEQVLLLQEILRTEPIVGVLSRRSTEDIELPGDPPVKIPAGTLFEIDIRSANTDATEVGACPNAVVFDRSTVSKPLAGAMFSFGDGVHRCPGAQVAMQESAVFLDMLLRVPGIRLSGPPTIAWKGLIEGYEIGNAAITCDKVPLNS